LDVGRSCFFADDGELFEESFLLQVLRFGIFHPHDTVHIAQVRVPLLVVIASKTMFMAVSRRRNEN